MERASPPASGVTVTVALEMTAPELSVMTPAMLPLVVCANDVMANAHNNNRKLKERINRPSISMVVPFKIGETLLLSH
jgi:hypothetical protein